jgi:hypothetical protein
MRRRGSEAGPVARHVAVVADVVATRPPAGIDDTVAVAVDLGRVVGPGAAVEGVADQVALGVVQRVAGTGDVEEVDGPVRVGIARVAQVADRVRVAVGLRGVRERRAVVDQVQDAVAVVVATRAVAVSGGGNVGLGHEIEAAGIVEPRVAPARRTQCEVGQLIAIDVSDGGDGRARELVGLRAGVDRAGHRVADLRDRHAALGAACGHLPIDEVDGARVGQRQPTDQGVGVRRGQQDVVETVPRHVAHAGQAAAQPVAGVLADPDHAVQRRAEVVGEVDAVGQRGRGVDRAPGIGQQRRVVVRSATEDVVHAVDPAVASGGDRGAEVLEWLGAHDPGAGGGDADRGHEDVVGAEVLVQPDDVDGAGLGSRKAWWAWPIHSWRRALAACWSACGRSTTGRRRFS